MVKLEDAINDAATHGLQDIGLFCENFLDIVGLSDAVYTREGDPTYDYLFDLCVQYKDARDQRQRNKISEKIRSAVGLYL